MPSLNDTALSCNKYLKINFCKTILQDHSLLYDCVITKNPPVFRVFRNGHMDFPVICFPHFSHFFHIMKRMDRDLPGCRYPIHLIISSKGNAYMMMNTQKHNEDPKHVQEILGSTKVVDECGDCHNHRFCTVSGGLCIRIITATIAMRSNSVPTSPMDNS